MLKAIASWNISHVRKTKLESREKKFSRLLFLLRIASAHAGFHERLLYDLR